MRTIAISIDESTLATLDRMAAGSSNDAKTRTRSAIVRAAVSEYFARAKTAAREANDRKAYAAHRTELVEELAELVTEQAHP